MQCNMEWCSNSDGGFREGDKELLLESHDPGQQHPGSETGGSTVYTAKGEVGASGHKVLSTVRGFLRLSSTR